MYFADDFEDGGGVDVAYADGQDVSHHHHEYGDAFEKVHVVHPRLIFFGHNGYSGNSGSDGGGNAGSDALLSFFPIVPIILMRFGFRMRRA